MGFETVFGVAGGAGAASFTVAGWCACWVDPAVEERLRSADEGEIVEEGVSRVGGRMGAVRLLVWLRGFRVGHGVVPGDAVVRLVVGTKVLGWGGVASVAFSPSSYASDVRVELPEERVPQGDVYGCLRDASF